MSKRVIVLFIVIFTVWILSFVNAASVSASMTKPSVPEFTVKVLDHSYDVPATYETDPYTGSTTMTQAGYHAQNGTIHLMIKNQPFTPYKDGDGHSISLYYRVRSKGHFSDSWSYDYPDNDYYEYAAASDYTGMSFKYGEDSQGNSNFGEISAGGQIDFQVEAFIGYSAMVEEPPAFPPWSMEPTYKQVFDGVASGWSDTQTVTVGVSMLLIAALTAAVTTAAVIVGVLVYFRKRSRRKTTNVSAVANEEKKKLG